MKNFDSMCRLVRIAAISGILAASLAVLSCQTAAPVRVEGNPTALANLTGAWEGEYSGGPKGRHGKIRFTFTAVGEQARGEIWMTPAGDKDQDQARISRGEAAVPNSPRLLRIQVVELVDGQVKGRLEPYWDPDCDCEAKTTFEGRIDGDLIEGSFFASTSNTPSGRWKVSRRR
jgi:hypothetical protein